MKAQSESEAMSSTIVSDAPTEMHYAQSGGTGWIVAAVLFLAVVAGMIWRATHRRSELRRYSRT